MFDITILYNKKAPARYSVAFKNISNFYSHPSTSLLELKLLILFY